jgi:hypothetical protein
MGVFRILRRFRVTTASSPPGRGASRERTHLALHGIRETDHIPRTDGSGGGAGAGLGEGAGSGKAGYGKHGSY